MNIDIKLLAPYLIMVLGFAMTWGMWSERLDALETKTDKVAEMQQNIAIIQEKSIWMAEYLIKTSEVSF